MVAALGGSHVVGSNEVEGEDASGSVDETAQRSDAGQVGWSPDGNVLDAVQVDPVARAALLERVAGAREGTVSFGGGDVAGGQGLAAKALPAIGDGSEGVLSVGTKLDAALDRHVVRSIAAGLDGPLITDIVVVAAERGGNRRLSLDVLTGERIDCRRKDWKDRQELPEAQVSGSHVGMAQTSKSGPRGQGKSEEKERTA